MIFWVHELDRLRRKQQPENRPQLELPVPEPRQGPRDIEEDKPERGVVIIGNDSDDIEHGIVIKM